MTVFATARSARRASAAGLGAAALVAALHFVAPAGAAPAPGVYASSVGVDTPFTVPSGVCGIDWTVVGGQGGPSSTSDTPGLGGEVQAHSDVTAGDQFLLQVGAAGPSGFGTSGTVTGGTSGAIASGGDATSIGTDWGGTGGGASAVLLGPSPGGTALIIAGGGGGAGNGTGGGNAGANGSTAGDYFVGPYIFGGGGGATTTTPGVGGSSDLGPAGTAGSGRRGGDAGEGSGAGGGGSYGGGSGGQLAVQEGPGGGGGSNLAPVDASVNGTSSNTGNGYIRGIYVDCPGAGTGGTTTPTSTPAFLPTTTPEPPAPVTAPTPEPPVAPPAPAPARPTYPANPSPEAYGVQPPSAATVVQVTPGNRAPMRLTCPAVTNGCTSSGVMTLPRSATRSAARAAATTSLTLASFQNVAIAAGQSRILAVKLRPSVVKRLQRAGVRKVSARLVIDNALAGGPTVRTTSRVTLKIPR